MTHSQPIALNTKRLPVWLAPILAALVVACGSSPSSLLPTAPSAVSSPVLSDTAGATLSAQKAKDGKPEHPTSPAPTTDATPTTGTIPAIDEDGDEDKPGKRQYEGLVTSVTGTCPALTIEFLGKTITTDAATEFQRADCEQIADGMRLHIGGHIDAGSFVASYVRMQGKKLGDAEDEDGDDELTTTPPVVP